LQSFGRIPAVVKLGLEALSIAPPTTSNPTKFGELANAASAKRGSEGYWGLKGGRFERVSSIQPSFGEEVAAM